ncbi:MAG: cytochrome c oxidase accessory protein CcoG [Planctomycetes bacterium]|nr:cytochrome c oxidase accessory protein CcoG [Planctomycetota bacterium]
MTDATERGAAAAPGEVGRPQVVKGRAPVRRPDIDTLFSINPDGSRNVIHPADVKGRFQTRKHLLWYLLLGIYLALPWVKVGGEPALLLDVPSRHFYLFGNTFNAQDFWLAFFFVSGTGFTLFVVAALWGRIWCGYACPQTVFLEGLFRRIERWIEGPAAARAKLDKARLSGAKLARRGLKMVVFLLLTAVVTHSFLGYFMPVEVLVAAMTSSPSHHPFAFVFALVTTLILFVNFTWFREQLCIVVCPYGRLQAALYDADTVLVGYDAGRGDPRGSAGTEGAGDCVDCYRCVAVCPTGIDIRNGTQLECVGCANCIDACDAVMDKLERPRGLVRYDSQRGLELGQRRFLRGRVFFYAVLLLLGIGVFTFAASSRKPFEANLLRARGTTYTIEGDRVHSVYELHLINKRPEKRRFTIEKVGPEAAEIVLAMVEVDLDTLDEMRVPVHVFVPVDRFRTGMRCELKVRCEEPDAVLERLATVPMLGPSSRAK